MELPLRKGTDDHLSPLPGLDCSRQISHRLRGGLQIYRPAGARKQRRNNEETRHDEETMKTSQRNYKDGFHPRKA
jgi:ribonuclease BN (tRNA processing enzyme)